MLRRIYCFATLCYVFDYVGGQYSPDLPRPWREITLTAQQTWTRAHRSSVFRRLEHL